MKENRTRNRYFCAILYKEDVNFTYYKENIEKNYEEVTYIKHDRDIEKDGNYKKEHYHYLFKVRRKRKDNNISIKNNRNSTKLYTRL